MAYPDNANLALPGGPDEPAPRCECGYRTSNMVECRDGERRCMSCAAEADAPAQLRADRDMVDGYTNAMHDLAMDAMPAPDDVYSYKARFARQVAEDVLAEAVEKLRERLECITRRAAA